ncbi:hypothetical protein D9757_004756 [Collybiopsis confluens]|uniref:Uncharacterized protein n=1 Tax=Collybiopsis confluens TaxID=2823264 RepID=A0A8H5MBT0_9AGAR|nr:hypothetical protein D9757_004756 [Collybiopsis confluens]
MSSTILPVELVQLITEELWASPLSCADRISFMTSSLAVNRTWTSIYMRIFCRDVHIPSVAFALKFLSILRHESPFYDYYTARGSLFSQLCRSVSFQSDHPRTSKMPSPTSCPPASWSSTPEPDLSSESPMGLAIHTVLRFISLTNIAGIYPYTPLPDLDRISIQFLNTPLRDLFIRNKFAGFPSQVTELEIDFVYDLNEEEEEYWQKVVEKEEKYLVGLIPGSLGSVKKLHAVGLTKSILGELVEACSNWEELEVERWWCRLSQKEKGGEDHLELDW